MAGYHPQGRRHGVQPPGEEGGGTKCSPLAAPPPPASLCGCGVRNAFTSPAPWNSTVLGRVHYFWRCTRCYA